MAADRMTPQEEWLISEEPFRQNAIKIISEMLEMMDKSSAPATLLDEVLHSIFFLGKINHPQFTPQMIFADDEKLLADLKRFYPRPFTHYSSHLPKRSPFSCVLDMVVHVNGQRSEDDIKQRLQILRDQLSNNRLVSSTICVSQNTATEGSVRYYGVSMSTSGVEEGQIMVAASCFSYWNSHVADAVLTYYPNKEKKRYFDGTLRLPEGVRCQAFSLRDGAEMSPCRSCRDMFGLTTANTQGWAYGNCAEAESLSNLFNNEQAQPIANIHGEENRRRAKTRALGHLRGLLSKKNFTWDDMVYPDTRVVV